MRRVLFASFAFVLLLAAFLAGVRWGRSDPGPGDTGRKISHYSCPMHPQYRSDRPGDCPSCGMRLEPVYSGGESNRGAAESGAPTAAGAVRVSPERQQTIGVRLGVAERISGTRTLRTTGRVAPNENAIYPVVAGSEGWVREVRGATTGSLVSRGEVLLTTFSTDFLAAQQSYYAGLDTVGRVTNDQYVGYDRVRIEDSLQRAANTLRYLGVSDRQLSEMSAKREIRQFIELESPVDGFVLQRSAAAGIRFEKGYEFFRIADLRRVWILADLYGNQSRFVRPGSVARVTTQDQPRAFDATVSRSEPTFDEATRTLKVRLETANPGLALKPGMFVDVEFSIDVPPTLAVPADAIVDSGMRKTVFVERGAGFFEPRQVETGWRLSDQVEILKGLMPGERIVISGTFLIDSESRMKSAAQGVFGAAATDPVCGMEVDQKKAAASGRTTVHEGHTYYFCADECKKKFEAEPAKYMAEARANRAPSAPAAEPATVKDLVCGMDIDPKKAAAAGLMSDYKGKTYYFCAEDCKKQFDAEPAKFTAK